MNLIHEMSIVGLVAAPLVIFPSGCSSTTGTDLGDRTTRAGGGSTSITGSSGGDTRSAGATTRSARAIGSGINSSSGGGTPSSGSTGGVSDDAQCASADAEACVMCCESHHPSGLQTYQTAFGQCECVSPGVCRTECSASCSGGQRDATCDQCISDSLDPGASGTCLQALQVACDADQDCVALFNCAYQPGCGT